MSRPVGRKSKPMNRETRQAITYESAQPVGDADMEAFVKAFGFESPRHFDDVLARRAPSALCDSRMHDKSWNRWRTAGR